MKDTPVRLEVVGWQDDMRDVEGSPWLRCRLAAASLLLIATATTQRPAPAPGTGDEGSSRWDIECFPVEFTSPPPESSAAVEPLRVDLFWLREGTAVLVGHGDHLALLEGNAPRRRALDWPIANGIGVTAAGHVVLVRPDGLQWRDPSDGAVVARSDASLEEWAWDVHCEGSSVLLHVSWAAKWREVDAPGAAVRVVQADGSVLWSTRTGPCLVYCVADGPRTDLRYEPPGIVRAIAGRRSIFDGYRLDEAVPAQGPMRDRGEALMWVDSANRVVVAREVRDAEGAGGDSRVERLHPLRVFTSTMAVALVDRDHVARTNDAEVELFAVRPRGAKRLQRWRCDGRVLAVQAHPVQNRMLIAYEAGDTVRVRLVAWE